MPGSRTDIAALGQRQEKGGRIFWRRLGASGAITLWQGLAPGRHARSGSARCLVLSAALTFALFPLALFAFHPYRSQQPIRISSDRLRNRHHAWPPLRRICARRHRPCPEFGSLHPARRETLRVRQLGERSESSRIAATAKRRVVPEYGDRRRPASPLTDDLLSGFSARVAPWTDSPLAGSRSVAVPGRYVGRHPWPPARLQPVRCHTDESHLAKPRPNSPLSEPRTPDGLVLRASPRNLILTRSMAPL